MTSTVRVLHPNSKLHCVHGIALDQPCRYCDPAERQREYDAILDKAVPSRSKAPVVVE